MTILLIGKNGQVGWELQRTLAALAPIVAVDFPEIDLLNSDAIRTLVERTSPNLIVNAAAYTAVDQAESEAEVAMAINATAPGILAEAAKARNIPLVHYSTDYVYNGEGTVAYREDNATGPLGVYGQSKLAGDNAIEATGCAHFIFRTSWVYGMRGKNFLLTMLRLAREKEELAIVGDQIGAPTWSRLIAEVTAFALTRCWDNTKGDLGLWEKRGVYHLAPSGETSWYGFAEAIFREDPRKEEQVLKQLRSIKTEDYPTPAKRPANSRLNCNKLQETFGLHLHPWETSLQLAIAEDL